MRLPRPSRPRLRRRAPQTTVRAARRQRAPLPIEGQVLLLVTLALTAFGQVMVYSASSPLGLTDKQYDGDSLHFVKTGGAYALVGLVIMLVVARLPTRSFRALGPMALLASFVLLVAVLVPGVGQEINGARRWIALGPITVQPSELAKLGLLVTVAVLLSARRRPPQTVMELVRPIGILTGLVCMLVMIEPDLGTTLAITVMVASMLIVAGTPSGLLFRVGALATLLIGAAIWFEPYRRDRFFAFLDPWADSADTYQVKQAMIAIGSGGTHGVGLGGSVQKVNYLPEAHTDMIFAVIGEELGFLGAVLVVLAFGLFAWAGFTIALRSRDPFSRILASGATALIAGQAGINLGAVMGILPLTGIPLPLISYGSSSKLALLAIVGALLSICRETGGAVDRALLEVEETRERAEAEDAERERRAAPRRGPATPKRPTEAPRRAARAR